MSAKDKPRYYVTTPIYYVNDVPHIGHAYTTLACDVLARFKRLDGYDVRFLTGTDEHGQKNEKAAKAAGIDPQAFVDKVSQNFRNLAQTMNYSNDDFIRTTEERHKRSCQALWRRLVENDQIYLGSYAGWYAVRDEAYYDEKELKDGPNGKKIAPSGAEVEWVEEPSYFFKLSEWQEPLLAHYRDNPDFILPDTRRNEMTSFVKGGLRDLSISRTTFKWGVPVPDDPDHVMYVWIDALTNYITALGFPDEESANFKTYWPADLHVVGKDILRFHTVYWPAFLMGAGVALPKRVFGHGWLLSDDGEKMSKSLGNVIRAEDLVTHYGLDQVRYYLLREVPFGNDGNISHDTMVERIDSDLANGLGNLAQRVLSMIAKNCGGSVPEPGAFAEADRALLDQAGGLLQQLRDHYDAQAFSKALEATWEVIRAGDVYIDHQAPWKLRKTDPARMATVLYVGAEVVRHLAILTQPVMPDTMARLLALLDVAEDARDVDALSAPLVPGTALPKPQGVFPRFVEPEKAAS